MKIYFCGSIRGGREDAELYAHMIRKLKEYGTVLTEHIGNDAVLKPEFEGSDQNIWQQDTAWLRESDIVIAECTRPSLGVGYELAYAESLGKPVHVLYRKPLETLSAMITGDSYFTIHTYEDASELPHILKSIFSEAKA